MKRQLKKWAAIILSCCLALSVWPMAAFAAGTGEFDPAENLLQNPGMEEGNQNEWSFDSSKVIINYITTVVHSGKIAMSALSRSQTLIQISQEVDIPETGLYEFSGYFATNSDFVTIRAGEGESNAVTFPGNNFVWEKQSVFFHANAGETVRIEISFNPVQNMKGVAIDDVSLTRCEGTTFGDLEDTLSASGGFNVRNPEQALQGEYCQLSFSGSTLDFSGPALQEGVYLLSFFVRAADESGASCGFSIDVPPSGEAFEEALDVAGRWRNISVRVTLEQPAELSFAIGMTGLQAVLVDNVSIVRLSDLPPVPPAEQLTNRGFESGLANWSRQQGSPSASILVTTMQAHSGGRALYMGYFATEAMNNYLSQDSSAGSGRYDFSAYIKTEASLSGVGAFLLLEAKDASGNVLAAAASPAVSNSNGEWSLACVTLTAPEGAKTVTAKIGGLYCTGGFYVDDVSLLYTK